MNKRSKSSTNLSILQEKLALKSVEYDQLQSKVDRSRPILQTIYTKVKLKQSLYEKKIQKSKRQITDSRELAKQYKQLFEDGLRIMEKSKIMDKSRFQRNYVDMKHNQKTFKSKSIYQQYRQRIDGGKQLKNPETKKICEKAKQMSNDMKDEIQKMRLARSKSQKLMGKSKSSIILKKATHTQINREELKDKFLQKQKQKFSQI